jgi:integrase
MAKRGNNEGSIFKKANSKWRAQVSVQGKRLSFTGESRAACADWLRRTQAQIDQGMTVATRKLVLADYLREWIAAKQNTLRPRTVIQYERLIALYIRPMLGRIVLKDLTLRTVEQFYCRLREQGVGPSNIRYAHRVLHAALEDAAVRAMIGRNAAHGAILPRRTQREMGILNEQQAGNFLVAASNSRYYALFHLAISTGMRFSELRGLYWTDVAWTQGTITVRRQIQEIAGQGSVICEPKTKSGVRSIRLGEGCLQALRRHKQRQEVEQAAAADSWREQGLIFTTGIGTPFVPLVVRQDFVNALRAANLPRIRFHDLRHTASSLMLNHGVSSVVVSKRLGHANPSITLSIYAHATIDMQTHAASVMDEILAPEAISITALHPVAPDSTRE